MPKGAGDLGERDTTEVDRGMELRFGCLACRPLAVLLVGLTAKTIEVQVPNITGVGRGVLCDVSEVLERYRNFQDPVLVCIRVVVECAGNARCDSDPFSVPLSLYGHI